jgi:hypothetical protein
VAATGTSRYAARDRCLADEAVAFRLRPPQSGSMVARDSRVQPPRHQDLSPDNQVWADRICRDRCCGSSTPRLFARAPSRNRPSKQNQEMIKRDHRARSPFLALERILVKSPSTRRDSMRSLATALILRNSRP